MSKPNRRAVLRAARAFDCVTIDEFVAWVDDGDEVPEGVGKMRARFCGDCEHVFAAEMVIAGRCNNVSIFTRNEPNRVDAGT